MHTSYDEDFYGWIQEQVEFLKKHDFAHIDFVNIVEEIETLGRSERRELKSHLTNLLLHLLKINYQPEKRIRSWDLSVKNARQAAREVLNESPSLNHSLADLFDEAYQRARDQAIDETSLTGNAFPEKCPWSLNEVL